MRAQRAGLAIGGQAGGGSKCPEQVEQQQNAAKGGFGGKEFLLSKTVGGQIVFQFGDTGFHV